VLLAFGTALSCYVLFDLLLYLDLPAAFGVGALAVFPEIR